MSALDLHADGLKLEKNFLVHRDYLGEPYPCVEQLVVDELWTRWHEAVTTGGLVALGHPVVTCHVPTEAQRRELPHYMRDMFSYRIIGYACHVEYVDGRATVTPTGVVR